MCRGGDPMGCWWECTSVQPQWQTVWGILKIINTATMRPSNFSIESFLENTKTLPQKERCTPKFTGASFTISTHGNINLESIMLSNLDTEWQTPGALMSIPHGNKNTMNTYIIETNWWLPDSGKLGVGWQETDEGDQRHNVWVIKSAGHRKFCVTWRLKLTL